MAYHRVFNKSITKTKVPLMEQGLFLVGFVLLSLVFCVTFYQWLFVFFVIARSVILRYSVSFLSRTLCHLSNLSSTSSALGDNTRLTRYISLVRPHLLFYAHYVKEIKWEWILKTKYQFHIKYSSFLYVKFNTMYQQ